jgi:hypothetical protein
MFKGALRAVRQGYIDHNFLGLKIKKHRSPVGLRHGNQQGEMAWNMPRTRRYALHVDVPKLGVLGKKVNEKRVFTQACKQKKHRRSGVFSNPLLY